MTPGQVGGLQKTITQPALPARAFQILSLLPSFTIFYSVTREGCENVFRKNKKVVRSLLDLLSEFVHLSDWKSSPQFRVPAVSPESLCFCWKNFQKLLHEVRAGSQEWRQRFNWLPCSLGHVRSMKTTLWAWKGLFSPKPGILAVTQTISVSWGPLKPLSMQNERYALVFGQHSPNIIRKSIMWWKERLARWILQKRTDDCNSGLSRN